MDRWLNSELNVLATQLSRIALADRHTCDFTLKALRDALTEVIAKFPVYRTYVRRKKSRRPTAGISERRSMARKPEARVQIRRCTTLFTKFC
jgi:(1->4)-alpha-D-glucan 1-alpha-D-glucosylmutase